MIIPPSAGPAENPRFIAKRIKETDRVLFSVLLYALRATYTAGLKASAKAIRINIPMQIAQKLVRN